MQSHICCPECGSREIRADVDIKNTKKSIPTYIHRRCENCGAEFIAPDEYRRAVNDIQSESRKASKVIATAGSAAILLGASILLNAAVYGINTLGIVLSSSFIGVGVLAFITAAAVRLSAHSRMFKLECEMEESCERASHMV